MKNWYTSKTIWTAVVAIIGAIASYMTGEIALGKLLELSVMALIAIFLRTGMNKTIGR